MVKHRFPISIIGILISIFLAGCDRRVLEIPTSPYDVSVSDAKRALVFDYLMANSYSISLYNTNDDYTGAEEDSVVVKIGEELIPLYYHYMPVWINNWISESPFMFSQSETASLYINGKKIISTVIKPITPSNVAFLDYYDFNEEIDLNWSLSSVNEYQFVGIESRDDYMVGALFPLDEYVKRVANNLSNYTFPANCVSAAYEDTTGTTYTIFVEQVNYQVKNNTAIMVYDKNSQSYSGHLKSMHREEFGDSFIRRFNTLKTQVNKS